MLDRNSYVPLYCQLAEEIRQQILSGEIRPGDKLPSESEMMQIYDIGRPTVRQALSQLVNKGYLAKEHGRGTFCKSNIGTGDMLNIDVILDMEDTYFIPYYLKSISGVLAENKCNCIVSDSKNSTSEICTLLKEILERGTAGVILQPSHIEETVPPELEECFRMYHRAGIPCIMIDCVYDVQNASYLVQDEFRGGYLAAQYLHGLGHTKTLILYVHEYKDSVQRKVGFCTACSDASAPQPALLSYEPSKGIPEAELLDILKKHGITGIFCYNDAIAVECIRILRNNGIRVPEDVSVIGYDDSVLAPASVPSLTTVAHPKGKLGTLAAETLLDFIHRRHSGTFVKVFSPSLVIRDSCCERK
ncbi:MAG: substrate-binding domain-containing protein [Clostridia bacterium]|nr:substrate-binding domain-containing protein [Clostridia bacterium]